MRTLFACIALSLCGIASVHAGSKHSVGSTSPAAIQLGTRPYYLVDTMADSELKQQLSACSNGPFYRSDFSIGHRGAPLQYPEHTRESYIAAARMGAGIVECDVTFTQDKQRVCRHSQCDLHTTTNILATDLASQCSQPFTPARGDQPASAMCCTSDITLAEFKTLRGKMDGANLQATTVAEYLNGTPSWRTDLYASQGTLLSHQESIALFKALGVKMTPELKIPAVDMPFNGLSQHDYARQMLDDYSQAGVAPEHVWPQSFLLEDILYWIEHHPEFGKHAVYLDDRDEAQHSPLEAQATPEVIVNQPELLKPTMAELKAMGVNIIAPPLWMLVTTDAGRIVASNYAKAANAAGLDIIAWTLERSGPLKHGGGWYYQSLQPVINSDGDMMQLLDVLTQEVGVIAVFSDWPATTTYYANCMNIQH